MSLIGTLEQFPLSNVMSGLEMHVKTGLLIVKQGVKWVELYFRDGRLMCFGPVRADAMLGSRLVQDGVISPQALQEALLALGSAHPSETRLALTLMDLGHVGRDELRHWGTRKALEVLQVLLSWSDGEIYFEEHVQTPPERLLVALAVAELLAVMPAPRPVQAAVPVPVTRHLQSLANPVASAVTPAQPLPVVSVPDMAYPPTLHDTAQFLPDTPPAPVSFTAAESFLPAFDVSDSPDLNFSSAAPPAVPGPLLVAPSYVDASFLRPDMVLVPADLTALHEQNAQVQLTPEHWRLLTRVDGVTPLQAACQVLAMPPDMICHIAAELLALGLLQLSQAPTTPMSEFSPVSRDLIAAGLSKGHVSPGYAATAAPPWSAGLSAPGVPMQFSPSSFETQSQWGNGGNGAKFIPGRGWIASPQSMQPLQSSGPLATYSGSYVSAGGRQ